VILYKKAQNGSSVQTDKFLPTKQYNLDLLPLDTAKFKPLIKSDTTKSNLPGGKVNDPGFFMGNKDLHRMGVDTTITPVTMPSYRKDTLYYIPK